MTRSLMRTGGALLLVYALAGIVLDIVESILPADRPTTNPSVIATGWADIGFSVLVLIGIVVLGGVVASRSFVLGLLGTGLLMIAFLAYGVILGFERAVDSPYLVTHNVDLSSGPPLGMILVLIVGGVSKMIGAVLLGIAMFRTRTFSPAVPVLFIAASAIFASGLIPKVPEAVDVVSGVIFLVGLGIAGAQLAGVWRPITEGDAAMTQRVAAA